MRTKNAISQTNAAAFVLAVSAFLFTLGNTYNSDEGVILNGAWKMFLGKRLYTDFFSFFAPGSYLVTYASFRLLGAHYFSARLFSVLLLMLSVYCVYSIARLFGEKRIAIASAALWMICSLISMVVINYNTLSSYIAALGVWLLIKAVKEKRALLYCLSGFFLGAVTVFLQTKGIMLGVGFLIFLWYHAVRKTAAWHHLIIFFLSYIILPGAAVLYWSPSLLYRLLILWPIHSNYLAINHVSYIPISGAFMLLGMLVFLILRLHIMDNDILAILTVAQIVLLLSTMNHPDIFHILWNSFCTCILVAYAGYHYARDATEPLLDTLLVHIPLMVVFSISLSLAILSLEAQRAFGRHIAPLAFPSTNRIYAHPFLPGFYFELHIPDPYPYDTLLSNMYPPEAFEANLHMLFLQQPEYILANYAMVSKFSYQQDNPLDIYIRAHYTRTERLWRYVDVFKRNENSRIKKN